MVRIIDIIQMRMASISPIGLSDAGYRRGSLQRNCNIKDLAMGSVVSGEGKDLAQGEAMMLTSGSPIPSHTLIPK